ncbi:cytochrome P450 [Pseudonocardia sp. CA-142604]|uniref:cytochrome P450 n=1 Tax=Pseudonocardia sp. CA-142604 TaxID=3240024 RepID=UPI003D942EEC
MGSLQEKRTITMDRDPDHPFDPPPLLYRLRDAGPVVPVISNGGTPAWIVTRYEDQRTLLGDPRLSSDQTLPNFPVAVEGIKKSQAELSRTIITLDNPRHDVLRRMYGRDFTINRITALRPSIQGHVDNLIDDMLGGPKPADFVASVALALPTLVITDFLGVPYEDHQMFQGITEKIVSPELPAQELAEATSELVEYVGGLLDTKRDDPQDDMLSRLAGYWAAGEISRAEAIGAGMVLIPAGHETTANMITMSTIALLDHPDQLDQIRSGEDRELIANAVEELLRYNHVTHYGRRRVALADIEIGSQLILEGDGVILPGNLGDRDPDAFPGDPDELDIHRRSRHHLAFGYGIHQCLGQMLARAELQIVFSTLFRRIPTLDIAIPRDQIAFKSDLFVYGAYRLPVTW